MFHVCFRLITTALECEILRVNVVNVLHVNVVNVLHVTAVKCLTYVSD